MLRRGWQRLTLYLDAKDLKKLQAGRQVSIDMKDGHLYDLLQFHTGRKLECKIVVGDKPKQQETRRCVAKI